MSESSRLPQAASQYVPLAWIPLCAGLLMIGTFDSPLRADPITTDNLDSLAALKLATRLGTIAALFPFVLSRARLILASPQLRVYLAWFVLLAWAGLSVLWSPLKGISLGQAFSFGTLVLLSIGTALSVRSDRDAEYVLNRLTLTLGAVCLLVALVHLKSAYLSGLARDEALHDAPGLIHPTHAGATAGLAIFLIAVSSLGTRRFIRSPILIAGIMVVATYVLLAAASRTALIALVAAVFWVLATQLSIQRRFKLVVAAAVVVAVVLAVDPGLASPKLIIDKVQQYALRGESTQLVKSATGRDVLWQVLWESWKQSPWIGYGYFVGTRDGIVDVWNSAVNRPAHDIWLQSLVSMGIVGFVILIVALGSIAFLALHRSEAANAPRSWIRSLAIGFGVWFLIWSSMDSSILGPVGPEPVTFFVCMGLLVASSRFEHPVGTAELARSDN